MAASVLGSAVSGDIGLRLLLLPLGSNIVMRTACIQVYETFCKSCGNLKHHVYVIDSKRHNYLLAFPTGEGSRCLYRRYLRPFFVRHRARLDQVVNFASVEVARFLTVHKEEIQFIKAALARIAMSGSQMLRDIRQPMRQGRPAIEGHRERTEGSDAAADS